MSVKKVRHSQGMLTWKHLVDAGEFDIAGRQCCPLNDWGHHHGSKRERSVGEVKQEK
jgi:hypothetical protein